MILIPEEEKIVTEEGIANRGAGRGRLAAVGCRVSLRHTLGALVSETGGGSTPKTISPQHRKPKSKAPVETAMVLPMTRK